MQITVESEKKLSKQNDFSSSQLITQMRRRKITVQFTLRLTQEKKKKKNWHKPDIRWIVLQCGICACAHACDFIGSSGLFVHP